MDRRKIAAFAASAVLLVPLTAGAAQAAPLTGSGRGTWYEPGLGSCGTTSASSDSVVALSTNFGARYCGKSIKVTYKGRTVTATVADSCSSCGNGDLDMSPGAFNQLAPLGDATVPVSWSIS